MITNVNDRIEKKDFVRHIIWEKWNDPYGSDINDVEWPGAFGTSKTDKLIERSEKKEKQALGLDEEDEQEWDADELDYSHAHLVKSKMPNKDSTNIPIIATNMGLIPMLEHTRAGKIFNFWTAHTNFRMTRELLNIVNETDGVETLDLYTPYRWRVAIGKAFESHTVKENIARNLKAIPPKKSNEQQKNT